MRRSPLVAAAVLGLAALAMSAVSAPPRALPTTTTKMDEKAVIKHYPVLDAKGRKIGKQSWRVTKAGGNCCEVLLHAMRSGRLVEFGGTYPIYSDDQGKTWYEVAPAVPSTSRLPNPGPRKLGGGEGTLVMAPGGDIVGVGWDPYSGDRLQSFLYSAKEKTWVYGEQPLHEPFYDRQWIAVAKGPFTINGTTVPWVSLLLSNFNRHAVLMSTDGLNYVTPTQRDLDAVRNGTVTGYLPVKPDPDLDYMQEQAQTGMAMLSQYALSFDDSADCGTQILKSNGTWACFQLPNEVEIKGPLHTDSRGWLHEVYKDGGGEMVYRLSKDGGRKWVQRTVTFPGDPKGVETFDFKAHGKLGITAIAAHVEKDDGTFQDMVMRINTRTGVPVLERVYLVGAGNLVSTVGLDPVGLVLGTPSTRVDFTSVVILPNGKIAVSFADKEYDDPAIAVLA